MTGPRHDDDAGTDPHVDRDKSNQHRSEPLGSHEAQQVDGVVTAEYLRYLRDEIPDPRD